ncbi:phosphotransferase [Curtobacterium sp. MCBD17_030]|uniref:phosphotransferase n=1 Tax=Curtobacterium sp. MCBD17_030 TaxID=2175649 RepID=UPI000D88CF49|nr:phosphotransferase [Curtobacterium sp. MCBD17_030]PYY36519.1 aminoglycoside phosphotransferase [Curtobacterium sp. MCBD17_030]
MTIEMLWEQDDPTDVLRNRFGFADAEAVGDWVRSTVERHWRVRVGPPERMVMSDSNALAWVRGGDERLLVKWSVAPDRFERLAFTSDLTAWLGAQGLPVSTPVPTLEGEVQVTDDGISLGLQRVIDGAHLDVEDADQVRAAGATLARLHDALRSCPLHDSRPGVLSAPARLTDQIAGWIASEPPSLSQTARDVLWRMLERAPADLPPLQIVHGDYRAANILCVGTTVVGVLDFEELRLDHRIVEVARSAVMLGTLFRDWGPVPVSVRQQFLDGYQTVRALTDEELHWWPVLVLWYSLALVPPGDDPAGWGRAAIEQFETADGSSAGSYRSTVPVVFPPRHQRKCDHEDGPADDWHQVTDRRRTCQIQNRKEQRECPEDDRDDEPPADPAPGPLI